MPIDAEQVRQIAALARLKLDHGEIEKFRHDLESILDYVAMLEGLDLDDTTPTASTLDAGQPLRDDRTGGSLEPGEALQNAPDSGEGHFRVPKVIGE